MMKLTLCICLICVLLNAPACASAGAIESKVFEVRQGNPVEVEQIIKGVLSERGRTVLLVRERKILVQDTPEVLVLVEAMMQEFNAPVPHVRVEVAFRETSSSSQRGIQPSWRRGAVEIDVFESRGSGSTLSAPFIVVMSGQTAAIRVAREVPFVDYFYRVALGYGLVPASVRWESIGTQLAVTPQVYGNMIEVAVHPRITALVDGQWQTVDYRELQTVVRLADGQSRQIAGFNGADEEFNQRFFGVGSSRGSSSQSASFTVRADIQR